MLVSLKYYLEWCRLTKTGGKIYFWTINHVHVGDEKRTSLMARKITTSAERTRIENINKNVREKKKMIVKSGKKPIKADADARARARQLAEIED